MARAPLSLTILSASWPCWHSSSSMMCSNSRDRVFPAPTEPLLFGPAFHLDSTLSTAVQVLLTSLIYHDGFLTSLPAHFPSSHLLSTATRGAFQSLLRALPDYPQEQTQFLPRIFKPLCSRPSLHLQLPLSPSFLLRVPQIHQPYSGLRPWAIHPFLCRDHSSFFHSPQLPTFFLANSYLASRFKSNISSMERSPLQ